MTKGSDCGCRLVLVIAFVACGALGEAAPCAWADGTTAATKPPEAEGSETGEAAQQAQPEPGSADVSPSPAPAADIAASDVGGPDGLWVSGGVGVYVDDGDFGVLRLEVGMPFPIAEAPWLTLALPVSYYRESASLLGVEIEVAEVMAIPSVIREWPIKTTVGRLTVAAEGGAGIAFAALKTPDQAFMPGGWETDLLLAVRGAGSLRYALPSGLYLQAQPIGFVAGLGDNGNTAFEIALQAGYRWP